MPGGNPSADSVASTDRRGDAVASPFAKCSQKLPIGRGIKALNPGGAGAKPPHAAPITKLSFEARAPSHNALKVRCKSNLGAEGRRLLEGTKKERF